MATLLPLDATNGYYPGVNSLDTSGYIAVIAAFQKCYFACGKAIDDNGYFKLDFINTKITGVASGAFQIGEVVTQATSGAEGIYGECMDITLTTATMADDFTAGELVTQDTTGTGVYAKGYVAYSDKSNKKLYVYPLTYTLGTPILFVTGKVVTGAKSEKTITPSAVSNWYDYHVAPTASYGAVGRYHFIYRTTTTEFDDTNIITGANTGKTITPETGGVIAPPHWLPWIPVAGVMPDGGSNIGCLCFGRLFLNSMLNPHQWFCTRVFNPLDLDSGQTDVAAATTSQNAKAGEVGDVLVAMIPYKDFYLTWGCANEMWVLQSDPLMGGVNRCLSKTTGIFSPTSYCWDDKNNLSFLGTDGIYRLSSDAIINAQPPENMTKQHIPKLITSLGLNRRTDRVTMGYDKQRYGIKVSVTQQDGQWAVPWWLDLRTGGLFPDKYPSGQDAASLFYFDSYKSTERALLIGGYDGYIRKEDETAKSDEGDNAIDAYVCIGPFVAGENPRDKVEINEMSLTTGEETDGVTVESYRAKSADEVIANVLDSVTPDVTKTLAGEGLKNSITNRIVGRAIAVKISNTTIDESFSMEEINLSMKIDGRQK